MIGLIKKMMFLAIPAAIVFSCFYPYRKKALQAMKLKSSMQREIGLILFVMTIFGIFAVTLWPTYYWEDTAGVWGNLRLLIDRPSFDTDLNLIPFSTVIDYVKDAIERGPIYIIDFFIHLFGNIIMFAPVGFLVSALFRNPTWKRSAIIGCGMASFIEIVQYFIMRNTAVDDVIYNTFGCVCGYLLYLCIAKKNTRFLEKLRCVEAENE